MLKSKKTFMILFLIAGLLFLFGNAQMASAENGIFLSTLSRIHGYKISKDYGFITINHHDTNKVLITDINGHSYIKWLLSTRPNLAITTFRLINKYAPSGSNACINLKFYNGIYSSCEYVRLVMIKK
jgi:hypothetical protein